MAVGGGKDDGHFGYLYTHGFDDIDDSGDIDRLPAEAEEEQAEAYLEQTEGEHEALLDEEAREFGSIGRRIEAKDAQFAMEVMKFRGHVRQIGAEYFDAAESKVTC
jgi:hypothetical protein